MNPPAEVIIELVQLFSNQKFNNLINEVGNLLDDYHNSCKICNLLGSSHCAFEKLDDKICNHGISIDINPKYAPTYKNKENSMRILGKNKKMLTYCSEAIAIEPNFAR